MVIDASEEKSDPPARGALPCSAGEEVLARRIGRNELDTIQVLKAMADAQIEYARADWVGTGELAYAQKFASSPGKKDGLYWPVKDGEPPSPPRTAGRAGGHGGLHDRESHSLSRVPVPHPHGTGQ